MSVRSLKEKQRLRHLAQEKREVIDHLNRVLGSRGTKIWLGQPGEPGIGGVEIWDLKKDTETGKLYRRANDNNSWVELG